MTAQRHENILYKGKETIMYGAPLYDYLEKNNIRINIVSVINTGCYRGYYGTWEIKNGKLFLVDIEFVSDFDENGNKLDLNYLFPNQEEVFADWFTGEIGIPYGKELGGWYGFEIYEKTINLGFKEGILISENIEDNYEKFEKWRKEEEKRKIEFERRQQEIQLEKRLQKIKNKSDK